METKAHLSEWSEAEDSIVLQGYGKMTTREIAEAIPSRTFMATQARIKQLRKQGKISPNPWVKSPPEPEEETGNGALPPEMATKAAVSVCSAAREEVHAMLNILHELERLPERSVRRILDWLADGMEADI